VKQQLILFLSAVQFFTRLPVPAWVGHSPEQLNHAARYFPLVGTLVGALSALLLLAIATLLPISLAVLLSMAFGILITGAFHEDGLTDFADGMGGGYTRERILDIMKDSRIGAYGTIAIALALSIKFAALVEIAGRVGAVGAALALMAAHTVSRLAAILIMSRLPYVREDGDARAKPAAHALDRESLIVAIVSVSLVLITLGGAWLYLPAAAPRQMAMTALLAFTLMALAWGYIYRKLHVHLGGYTGDCLGATQQLCEIACYLGFLVSWGAA
jgi:adenosylcobinamide-GDP ribazoletransferase